MRIRYQHLRGLALVDISTSYLSGKAMDQAPILKDAFLDIEDGLIADYGSMSEIPDAKPDQVIDAHGQWILPAFIDSHTHLLYAGNRAQEFEMRMRGATYEEIAAAGGGILNSAKALAEASEESLLEDLLGRLKSARQTGTAAVEIKSGYGLSVEAELKMLRVIRRAAAVQPMPIASTFLGAHAVPSGYDKAQYMDLVVQEMLPRVAAEQLADHVDIFCEDGYFDVDDTIRLAQAADQLGLPLKSHVNQFKSIGGLQASLQANALSVDHLEVLSDKDLYDLKSQHQNGSGSMPVALPLCSLYLDIPYTPGRRIIDADLPLAIASDCNPGSAPSSNLSLAWGLACHQMKLTPMEALSGLTINGASALGWSSRMGSITRGKEAHLILTQPIESPAEIPYRFGENLIAETLVFGSPE